jgi:hypothetical protein
VQVADTRGRKGLIRGDRSLSSSIEQDEEQCWKGAGMPQNRRVQGIVLVLQAGTPIEGVDAATRRVYDKAGGRIYVYTYIRSVGRSWGRKRRPGSRSQVCRLFGSSEVGTSCGVVWWLGLGRSLLRCGAG